MTEGGEIDKKEKEQVPACGSKLLRLANANLSRGECNDFNVPWHLKFAIEARHLVILQEFSFRD